MTWQIAGGCLLLALVACDAERAQRSGGGGSKPGVVKPAEPDKPQVLKRVKNGRLEKYGTMRIVHLFGTPEERGRAHAVLLGAEIVELVRAEFNGSFGHQPQLLALARGALKTLVLYPEPIERELEAMFDVIKNSGLDLSLKRFKRDFDFRDLLLVNALDIFSAMGCSGFTVWGDEVLGGGVLTTRNFDWPISGKHIVENTIIIVQHPRDGLATASVAWAGYVGCVTAINEKGVAVFLHQGNGSSTMKPEPESLPTATAARLILENGTATNAFQVAQEYLPQTSPPGSYLTRVVLPSSPETGNPVRVFEADHEQVRVRADVDRCVVTNHFLAGKEQRHYRDSHQRFGSITTCLEEYLGSADKKVSPVEAWGVLGKVQRDGQRFATLHSLVFRQEPWLFEVALGQFDDTGHLLGAPLAKRHQRIPRSVLFP